MRRRYSLPVLSFWVAIASILVMAVEPDPGAFATTIVVVDQPNGTTQSIVVTGSYTTSVVRDNYGSSQRGRVQLASASAPQPLHVPAAGVPNPGSAQAIAHGMVLARGWDESQYSCLVALWNRESHWNVYASNASGAYGIPQALPGSKMAAFGADWATNPATQIAWGLGYVQGRYGTPCGAWAHSQATGWY